jgi:cell envelope opacity-associated protein A
MDFQPGQQVRVRQKGTLYVGGMTLSDNTFERVQIVRKNTDGSYQVKGIVKTPETDEVRIPKEWIEEM